MSALQIIAEIMQLPLDEQVKVVNFVRQTAQHRNPCSHKWPTEGLPTSSQ